MSSSLVAYEDSDSEAEAGKSEDAGGSVSRATLDRSDTFSEHKGQLEEHMGSSRINIFPEDTFAQHLQSNRKSVVTTQSRKVYSATLKIASSNHNQLNPVLKPEMISGNESYSEKRACDDSDIAAQGLRPYIPKRLRQGKSLPHQEAENSRGGDSCAARPDPVEERMSINTSQYIMPYIGSKYGVTEIPKKLVFQMSKHSGPVNAVWWCPVQKWSHMLLSASMDKTIKVWDAVDQGCCLKTYYCHTSAVRAVQWSPCGRGVLSGGFDSMLHLTDIETGVQIFSTRSEFQISTLKFHPLDPNVFICGGFSPEVKAWDIRSSKAIKVYKAAAQQTLDIMFFPEGREFLTTTDAVSQDSADRTIIAWDFHTAAKISNQIFHERYTCPSLALHPKDPVFIAQTNGNYLALFSSLRPYKMNKKKRYEGHKVEGFAIGCEFSADGMVLATGSSEGKVFFYNYHTARIIRTLHAHSQACSTATFHPVLPSLLATCDWEGAIKIWQ
uniref:WD repeat domain 25 n=1 Tax=Salvator merianae TaxID=96440 RepID=A0A8D0BXC7_SALMN